MLIGIMHARHHPKRTKPKLTVNEANQIINPKNKWQREGHTA